MGMTFCIDVLMPMNKTGSFLPQIQPDALHELPTWAKEGRTWAPNITHIQENSSSTFVLFFVAWDGESDLQAIGIATSKNPEGPYKCDAARPFILQVTMLMSFQLATDRMWLIHHAAMAENGHDWPLQSWKAFECSSAMWIGHLQEY